jgi:di/tricarboxylate transporter
MDLQQILFVIIMISAIVLFVTEALRVDVIGILIILALTVAGLLDEKQALSGFASEPAIIVCAVFVLSGGLAYSGVTDVIGEWVGKLSGKNETRATGVIMTAVAALSAFTHHLMVTAMMLPIVMKTSKDKGLHTSRLLIPMATAASLGTTLTLIGAPAFLLANSILKRSGEPALHLFSIAPVGAALCLTGLVVCIALKWVLPKTSGVDDSNNWFKMSEVSTEISIPAGSTWIGQPLSVFKEATKDRFSIVSWVRDHRATFADDTAIVQEGDTFLVKTTSDELVSFDSKLGVALSAVEKFADGAVSGSGASATSDVKPTTLVEETQRIFKGVIAPNSEFVGKTLAQIRFHKRYGVIAIGLWRKNGWVSQGLSDTKLKEGDLLVLWGPQEKLEELTKHRGFLVFVQFYAKPKNRAKMGLAAGIMLASIVVAALSILPAHIAFLAGAVAMVLTRCLSVEQAYESIETKIFVMIAGVIPMGIAMEKTGVDKLCAQFITSYTQGWPPLALLLVFFWFAALLTQILSDAATTVLLAPIALAFAKTAAVSPTAAVVTTTMGAVAAFLTPIGHHGNLLILTPGGYKFSDFMKIGLPLTVLLSLVTAYLSLLVWPAHG